MPNRTIRESCRTSRTLHKLSAEAERLHWRLVTVADDYGRFNADPAVLKSLCFPLHADDRMCKQVSAWLQEMVNANLVATYTEDNETYGFYPNWQDSNGSPRAKRSKFPLPTSANICEHMSANVPDLRSSDLDLRSSISRSLGALSEPGEFEQFWNAYPRKKSKGDAEKAWAQTSKLRPPPAELLASLESLKRSEDWLKDSGQFIPYPASWLRAKGWEDVPTNGHSPLNESELIRELIESNAAKGMP